MTEYIAVDLGGTNIRAALYDSDGTQLARARQLTHAEEGTEAVTARIVETIRQVAPPDFASVAAVGIAAPGPLNPFTGVVLAPPNLPFRNFPLRDALQNALGLPVVIGNDANLAALAEWKFGAGRGYDDVLYLTISTGIGGGAICGGRLLLGKDGLAAEAGHMPIMEDGPLCSCGKRGHLEAVASGPAIARRAREEMEAGADSLMRELAAGELAAVTAATVGEAAKAGDALAVALLAEAGAYIGRAIAALMHLLNPGIVILGGGVAQTGEVLFAPLREAVREHAISPAYWEGVPIVEAQLGDEAGLVGAMVMAREVQLVHER